MNAEANVMDVSDLRPAADANPGDSRKVGVGEDPHPWSATIALTFALIAFALLWTMWLNPLLHHLNYWVIGGDSWSPLAAGRYVSAGAYGYLYTADKTWVAGPLLPVLLAPVSIIEDALRLTSRATAGYGFYLPNGRLAVSDVPYPSVWVLYGSYAMALSAVFLVAVRRTTWQLLGEDRSGHELLPAAVQSLTTAIGLTVVAGYWMHVEDVLAIAMVLFAAGALWERRWVRAGVFIALSISFKQWTALLALLLIARVPARDRARFLAVVLGIPAFLYGFPLLIAPRATSEALFHATSGPWQGHAAPWVVRPTALRLVAATPERVIWLLMAGAIAWLLRRRDEPEVLLAGATLILAARLLTESVVYSYYLFGVLVFMALLEVVQRRSVFRTTIFGSIAMAWFWVPPPHRWWWFVEIVLLVALVWPAIRTAATRQPVGTAVAEGQLPVPG